MKKFMQSKVFKSIVVGVGIVCIVGIGIYCNNFFTYKKIVQQITLQQVKVSHLPSGTYEGSFDAIFVGADVRVTLKDGFIETIELVHHKTDQGKAGEAVIHNVLEKQSLQVDTISGATNSSKVILKAIEKALLSSMDK